MSPATLLIVTARLRRFARAGGYRDPAPFRTLMGRGRITRQAAAPGYAIRREGAGRESPPCLRERSRPLACAGALSVPFPRARALVLAAIGALIGSASVSPDARAQTAGPTLPVALPPVQADAAADRADAPLRIGGEVPAPCVEVDIAGHRAGHLECATQQLEEAARTGQRQAETARNVAVAEAGSPDVEVGVASRAGTRLRLRENFGKSMRPPAPPLPVNANALGRTP